MKDLFLSILQEDYSDDVITVKKLPGGVKLVSLTDDPKRSVKIPERNFASKDEIAGKIVTRTGGDIDKDTAMQVASSLYKRKQQKSENEKRAAGFNTKKNFNV